jgi:hypothetical protein
MILNRKNTAVLFLAFIFSCASAPKDGEKPPLWISDLEAAYPSSQYIAGRGYGDTKQSAENAALAAISRYFTQKIAVTMEERAQVNAEGVSSSALSETLFVESQTELFAVHYAAAYYDAIGGQYEVAAYIDRAEAWRIYENELKQKAEVFQNLYEDAQNEQADYRKLAAFSKALRYASDHNIEKMIDFGTILYPTGAAFYQTTQEDRARIYADINRTKQRIIIYIECENDYENALYTAVEKALLDFNVVSKRSEANYLCSVVLIENKTENAGGTFYSPVIQVRLTERTGEVFSTSIEVPRLGATNPATALRRMYTSAASAVQTKLAERLESE